MGPLPWLCSPKNSRFLDERSGSSMSDTGMQEADLLMLQLGQAFADPELAAARASATPHQMYADLTATCQVRKLANKAYSLQNMADILYVNMHHDVEQAGKYLGSTRPAIPLGLDGPEHRKYRRLLDPVFTAKRVAPRAETVRTIANEMIDRFIDQREVDAYAQWCEPLPSTIFLSIIGLPMEDLDALLRYKDMTLRN